MIISAKKINDNILNVGNATKISKITGIPAATLQRWHREGNELKYRNGFIINFKVVVL